MKFFISQKEEMYQDISEKWFQIFYIKLKIQISNSDTKRSSYFFIVGKDIY